MPARISWARRPNHASSPWSPGLTSRFAPSSSAKHARITRNPTIPGARMAVSSSLPVPEGQRIQFSRRSVASIFRAISSFATPPGWESPGDTQSLDGSAASGKASSRSSTGVPVLLPTSRIGSWTPANS
ncbi:MAG: hypothetical protein MZV64_44260 [Ignavibacteriales bacterium]|nr:hypothetical protein [Ignavibacteriales bacterium]